MEMANNHAVLKRNERFPVLILLRGKKNALSEKVGRASTKRLVTQAKQASCSAVNTEDKTSMHRL